nr:MAG TPA: hypothetical protein [Caudoviricetes sp.]
MKKCQQTKEDSGLQKRASVLFYDLIKLLIIDPQE